MKQFEKKKKVLGSHLAYNYFVVMIVVVNFKKKKKKIQTFVLGDLELQWNNKIEMIFLHCNESHSLNSIILSITLSKFL